MGLPGKQRYTLLEVFNKDHSTVPTTKKEGTSGTNCAFKKQMFSDCQMKNHRTDTCGCNILKKQQPHE